jgi:hypothetical protein
MNESTQKLLAVLLPEEATHEKPINNTGARIAAYRTRLYPGSRDLRRRAQTRHEHEDPIFEFRRSSGDLCPDQHPR